ncbi:MAG: hypothetical protein JKX84_06440 [Flavobacteriales bacterium]|nr:hypothetical protein [Flavobacteriales bacterium]
MIKRMFFLSGIVAFLLASAAIWFGYLPRMEQQEAPLPKSQPQETIEILVDSVTVPVNDSLK